MHPLTTDLAQQILALVRIEAYSLLGAIQDGKTVLGGSAGSGGGTGEPPAGFVGQLTQSNVTFDTAGSTRACSAGSAGSSSLVDNLDAIRLGLEICDDAIGDRHIDWGTGAGQVSAVDVPFQSSSGSISATDVREAIEEAWLHGTGGSGVTDHGALTGLVPDDDHTQYLLAGGTRALSGAWDVGANLVTFDAGIAFDGPNDTNTITFPDNTPIAGELRDAGDMSYVQIVSSDAQPAFRINPDAVDIDTYISGSTPNAAIFVQGSDSAITLGGPSMTVPSTWNLIGADNVADMIGIDDAGGLEHMRVISTDSDPRVCLFPGGAGRVVIGGTFALDDLTVIDGGTDTWAGCVVATYNDQSDYASRWIMRKSHTDTLGNDATTQDGEIIGYISWEGANTIPGVVECALVQAVQDGAAGAVFIPGRIEFWTATNAAGTAKRMTIASNGNVGIGTPTPQEKLAVAGNIALPKTSGNGIKIDNTTPTFGWRDLRAEIRTRGVGSSDPNDTTYIGNIKAYTFSVGDEAWIEFHIPHDYVAGTDIHLHFHWSHNSAIVTGGTVTWEADVTYAKGHNQDAFPATVNPTLSPNASTTQYQHMVSEVQLSATSPSATQIDTDDLEPDGIVLARVYLSANNITSGGAVPDPFLHEVDIHYQSTNIATKQNAPDFYT